MTEDDLLNSSLLVKTPSKPRNPVFINSPPPPPKLQQQPQSPLQVHHQQQYQQQLLHQQLNSLATQGERLAFKAPKTQDLMTMRRYITAGNSSKIVFVLFLSIFCLPPSTTLNLFLARQGTKRQLKIWFGRIHVIWSRVAILRLSFKKDFTTLLCTWPPDTASMR